MKNRPGRDEKLNRTELEKRHTEDPDANPGDLSHDREPHHALNNPVGAPDETEWPDPYEKRPDPRDNAPAPKPPSTSEPHPPNDKDKLKPVKGSSEGG
ncbi:MAG TPA: hypothetical protein VNO20_10135 [Solirubrobacterales bacterium]|nr:hypothetical protein [Solirubrobacterales bacterium]